MKPKNKSEEEDKSLKEALERLQLAKTKHDKLLRLVVEANQEGWQKIVLLRKEYESAKAILTSLCKEFGRGIETVKVGFNEIDVYDEDKVIELARQHRWYERLMSLGIITMTVDQKALGEFLENNASLTKILEPVKRKEVVPSRMSGVPSLEKEAKLCDQD